MQEIDVASSRTLVIDAYVGHCRSTSPHACANSSDPAEWRWYGIQLPVYLRQVDTPPAAPAVVASGATDLISSRSTAQTEHNDARTPVDTFATSVATGTQGGGLQRLVAEVPCGLHHSAVMPSLGQGFAVFCMHMSGVPVVLLCVVPAAPAGLPTGVAPLATTAGSESRMHALTAVALDGHVSPTPPPQAHEAHACNEEAEPIAAVPQPQGALGAHGEGVGEGEAGQGHADTGGADAWRACMAGQEVEGDADCQLAAAIAELIKFKRNKYVQKKSPQAWRIEPHLPRDIAGALFHLVRFNFTAEYNKEVILEEEVLEYNKGDMN